MPYRTKADLPAYVKRRADDDQERWMSIWNDVFSKTGSETDAFKAANGALALAVRWADLRAHAESRRFHVVQSFVSDVFPEWNPAGVYKVQYLRSGLWRDHPEYGDILVENADLAEGVRNFRNASRRPFLDDDHGITNPEWSANPGVSFGWMRDLYIEDLDGNRIEPAEAEKSDAKVLIMFAEYEVNEQANEWLRDKKKPLFSPTFYPVYQNKETGEVQGLTVLGGAMTAIPYFDGMAPFVPIAASARAAHALGEMWPAAVVSVTRPDGMTTADAIARLDAIGFEVTQVEYWTLWAKAKDGGDLSSKIGELEAAGFSLGCFYQGVRQYDVRRGRRGPGGSESRADAAGGSEVRTNGNVEVQMRTAEERARLIKALQLNEAATDAEIDETIASLRAMSLRAPKAGEVVVAADRLRELEAKEKAADEAAARQHAERREAVVQGAVNAFKIKRAKKDEWLRRYDENPTETAAILDELEPHQEFKDEVGRGGTAGPTGTIVGAATGSATMQEIEHLTDQMLAERTDLKGDRAAARKLVFSKREDLYEAYRKESTRGGAKGGGD